MEIPIVYVVVRVTYDYYRFQENLAATTSLAEARLAADTAAAKFANGEVLLPVVCDGLSADLDATDTDHIWIESFA